MQSLIQKPPFTELLSRSWRKVTSLRVSSKVDYPNQSRGGLPRFHSEVLPPSKGSIVRAQGEEFWHMTKKIDKTGADFMALEDPKNCSCQEHTVALDWLVDKCPELGASSLTPLLTERSPSISENSHRLHEMSLKPPAKVANILPSIAQSKLSLLAAAEVTSLVSTLSNFTEKEVKMMTEPGAVPVGLGPHRLRVETVTMALLASVMLWSDSQHLVDP
ncbi:hypothetical protein MKX01_015019 [Papaver californicum]|nr:hypothetical protein MKX01_015019 [Papaver californicum]